MSDRLRQVPALDNAELGERLDALETLVVRALAVLSAAILVAGQLIPYVTATVNDERVRSSLLTLGFRSVTYRDDDGHGDAVTTAMGAGYLGLSLLTVVLVALLLTVVWWRSAEERSARWATAVAVLLVVGTLVQWLLVVIGTTGDREWDLHAGALVYSLGVALAGAVVLVADLRRMWLRDLR
jgi:hypothetical protein